MSRPIIEDIPSYYRPYVALVKGDDIAQGLQESAGHFNKILQDIPEERGDHRYAPGKWSIKGVLQHIIDTERIFNFRALSIARGETARLPGFDQDAYMAQSASDQRSFAALKEEFFALRKSSVLMYASFREEDLRREGEANGFKISANTIGYVSGGHMIHHMNVIKERYL